MNSYLYELLIRSVKHKECLWNAAKTQSSIFILLYGLFEKCWMHCRYIGSTPPPSNSHKWRQKGIPKLIKIISIILVVDEESASRVWVGWIVDPNDAQAAQRAQANGEDYQTSPRQNGDFRWLDRVSDFIDNTDIEDGGDDGMLLEIYIYLYLYIFFLVGRIFLFDVANDDSP